MAKNLAWQILVVSIALAAAAAAGCASEEEGKMGKTQTATISVTSTAFKEGGTIPKEYTADGENVSPPLAWKDLPEEAAAIALLCEDPDAPKGMFVHWVIFNVDPKSGGLPRAVPKTDTLPDGAAQARTASTRPATTAPRPRRAPRTATSSGSTPSTRSSISSRASRATPSARRWKATSSPRAP